MRTTKNNMSKKKTYLQVVIFIQNLNLFVNHKEGGWNFSKMAIIGGGGGFTRNGGKPWMGGSWFYNGRDGKFLKSLYIVGRGVLTPLFYEDLPILPIAPFWNVVHPPPQLLCHLQPPPPLFSLLSCFFSWMGDHATFDVLFNNIDLHMSSLGSLVPEGPWCVFYAIRHQVYWGLTHTI